MSPGLRSKILWTLWMSGGGIAIAAAVYAVTDSLGWALVGLLVAGPVLNAVAQVVVQPGKAVAARRRNP